jgi:hypothetical protein
MKVRFDEVSELFNGINIWCGGREILWYKKAWDALEKGGLATYENILEKYIILTRACTIIMIYMEFCELSFAEYCSYDLTDWMELADISEFRVGQLASKVFPNMDFSDYEDAFGVLVDEERNRVFDCLVNNIDPVGRESTIFVLMYLANMDMSDRNEDVIYVDDDGQPILDEEE